MGVSENAERDKVRGRNRVVQWFRNIRNERPELIWSPVLFVLVVLVWEWGVLILRIPYYILPPPSKIAAALYNGLAERPTSMSGYYIHAAYTLWESFVGFVIGSIAGIILGTLVAQNQFVERTLLPYIVAFQALPKIAVAPLFLVWLGFGMTSKILMVVLLTFFPLLINSLAGFKSVPKNRIDMARSLCATDWQIFRYVKFPSALPFIFAGLDMAAVFSVIGAIVGEFVGAQAGMGLMIMQMQTQMDIPGVFSALFVLSLMGVALHLMMEGVKRRVVFWQVEEEETRGEEE